jgi:hypothetical protein
MSPQPFRFEYIQVDRWPVLAWLARCHRGREVITVFHGSQVETTDDWFCEAAWAAPFGSGDFDMTDIVGGSGGRRREGEVVFVSPASTVDRLQSLETPDGPWISNSLACLMAVSGAQIDESSGRFHRLFRSVVKGVRKYARTIPTSAGPIVLTYFHNLAWNGQRLAPRDKPGVGRDFSSFEKYHAFLQASMRALAGNASDPARRQGYSLLSTASSGYDSSTITVLARDAGATEVLSFDHARRGMDDSGEPLARTLRMQPITVPRTAWRDGAGLPEVPFVASDAHGGDVFFRGAEPVLRNRVLLTGYHGDKLWAKDPHTPVNDEIVRGDQSGLSLTEYRLGIGTIHVPVAFWGVRQLADLLAISNSDAMKPWDVPGDYSRPICRRIVESAGVPREMFGMEKKAAWVLLHHADAFLSPASMPDYIQWVAERRGAWLRKGRIPPPLDPRFDNLDIAFRRTLGRIGAAEPPAWYKTLLRRTGAMRVVWRIGEAPTRLRRHLFAWALDRRRRDYPSPS